MTLGRTASNAIKIKTDGGLRAVECACCAPACEDYSFNGLIITKEAYDSWRKGGTIQVSGSVFDTSSNIQYQIDNGCPNGTCSWSYSNTITVPPNTCVFQFADSGQSVSCSSSYYGENQSPYIFLQAHAFKSKDEEGEVYRARLWLAIGCPHILWFNPCIMDMCWSNSIGGLGNTYQNIGDASVTFLGAQYKFISDISRNDPNTPDSTASLNFTFTPKP
jgi:hypothetical protein